MNFHKFINKSTKTKTREKNPIAPIKTGKNLLYK